MNGHEFTLAPLDCPTCGAAVAAAGEDVVFYCTACRNGYRYQDEEPHLAPLEVGFVASANISADRYLPFWVIEADVRITGRQAGRRTPARMPSLMHSFFERSGRKFETGKGRFVVPAFRSDLDATVELTRRYTASLPDLSERLGEKLTGGCFGLEDAEKIAHFAVIATEVDRADTLRGLKYSIEFGKARLLGAPFALDSNGWVDAVHGVRLLEVELS